VTRAPVVRAALVVLGILGTIALIVAILCVVVFVGAVYTATPA
jgi:hypothetical protein